MILGTFNNLNIVALPDYGLRDLQITANDTVSVGASPWTKQAYTYNWQAQWWAAQLNLPIMTRQQIAPWMAFLLELQGMGAQGLLGNILEAQPLGSFRSVNLVPDSDIENAAAYWVLGSGFSIDAGGSPNGKNALKIVGTGAADDVWSTSSAINVVPGETYTVSGYIDATYVSSAGLLQWGVYDPTATTLLGAAYQVSGQKGRVSATFAVPANLTQVVLLADMANAVATSGDAVIFAEPQLQAGSGTGYQAAMYLSLANAGASGSSIVVNGFGANQQNAFLPGDNLQIGYRLYKVMEAVNANSSGQATVSIYPYLRDNPAQYSLVQWQMCCGLFRLAKNARSWSASATSLWGVQALDFVEAL